MPRNAIALLLLAAAPFAQAEELSPAQLDAARQVYLGDAQC